MLLDKGSSSTDGGESWSATNYQINVSTGGWISRILAHPTDPNIMYASGSSGIFKTTDAWQTAMLVSTVNDIQDMEFQPGNPDIIYACSKSNTYIL